MAKNTLEFPSANIDISAKFEAKTEIPSTASGRALDAIVDLISPITEGAGFIGDKLSLARQKTLIEIAKATKQRLKLLDKKTKPIPVKFLIPLVEKASLEDVGDQKLIGMWANLVATAATDDVELLGQYATILSEITSSQVRIFEEIMIIDRIELGDSGRLVDQYYYYNQSGLPGAIEKLGRITDIDEFGDKLEEEFTTRGILIDTINIYLKDRSKGNYSLSRCGEKFSDENFYNYENLVRLGLLCRCEVKQHVVGVFDIDVHYYIVTPVGVDLYACCNPTKLTREHRASESAQHRKNGQAA